MDKRKLADVFDTHSTNPDHIPRLAPKTRADVDAEQQAIFDDIVDSDRGVKTMSNGALPGPFNAWFYVDPKLCEALEQIGNAINVYTQHVSNRTKEITICQVSAHVKCNLAFWAHARKGQIRFGVEQEIFDAIQTYQYPPFGDSEQGRKDAIVYRFTREYLQLNRVKDALYAEAMEALGSEQAMVELVLVIGHYSNLAAQLNILRVPAPGDSQPFG
ncbi:MAG: hypothetical protein AAF587_40310 [Bacteroidota bacterium]